MINAAMAQANWRDEPGPAYEEQRPTVTKGMRRVWEGWTA
jgi:hypothetical protein